MSSTTTTDLTLPAAPTATSTAVPGGAVAAILGALTLAAGNVVAGLFPEFDGTRELIVWFGANPVLTEIASALGLLSAALLVPGIWAATHRLRRRTPVLAATGGWAMATGYLMSTVLSIESLSMLALLQANVDPALMADAADHQATGTATALYVVFGLGALVGTLLIGIAMLRQQGTVPVWAGWAMILSAPVRMIGLFTGLTLVGPPLASVLIVVGFVGLFLAARR